MLGGVFPTPFEHVRNTMPQQAVHRLAALSPLKVLVVTDNSDSDQHKFFTAICRAFQGDNGGGSAASDGSDIYYASGEDLRVSVRCVNLKSETGHTPDIDEMLKTCGCILAVILVDNPIPRDSPQGQWLDKLGRLAISDDVAGRIGILPIALDRNAERLSIRSITEFQWLRVNDLGEAALRPGNLGLFVLQQSWTLLGRGLLESSAGERLRLFISHAKRDGAPFALSLKSHIESLGWMQRFYDADDILPGTRWRNVLRNGVQNSVLVVLRTDVYDQRAFCIQEIEWAQEFGCPAVMVEARQSNSMPRESLPVTDLSSVRVSDGNVFRILNSALREAVRLRLFESRVSILQRVGALPSEGVLSVPRVSLGALGIALEKCPNASTIQHVLLPDGFSKALKNVAAKLVQSYSSQAAINVPSSYLINDNASDSSENAE